MTSLGRSRSPRVLLVGWDAADWQVIHPLMDNGSMPNLQRLIEGGVIGNLGSLAPKVSPVLRVR
jgi:predicted AlkP superfamily phosphohydrolase/phosphomutase